LRWGCGAGCGAVAGGEDARDGVCGEGSAADLDEGSDDVADHVVKEAGAGDAVVDKVVFEGDLGCEERAGI